MSSIRRIRKSIEEGNSYLEAWTRTVQRSRIVVRSDDTSYVDQVGVYVSTIVRRQCVQGISSEALLKDYPGLTPEDLTACLKFISLRARRRI